MILKLNLYGRLALVKLPLNRCIFATFANIAPGLTCDPEEYQPFYEGRRRAPDVLPGQFAALGPCGGQHQQHQKTAERCANLLFFWILFQNCIMIHAIYSSNIIIKIIWLTKFWWQLLYRKCYNYIFIYNF